MIRFDQTVWTVEFSILDPTNTVFPKVKGDSASSIVKYGKEVFTLSLIFNYFKICQFSKAVLFTNTALGLKLLCIW